MKAILHFSVKCPKCGWTLICAPQSMTKDTVSCNNCDCENHKVKYRLPTIELEEIKEAVVKDSLEE